MNKTNTIANDGAGAAHELTGGPCVLLRHTSEESAAKREKVLRDFFAHHNKVNVERREAVELAAPALVRLCEVMRRRSGQSYKIRALLYSLFNGQATELNEVLGLDWEIRKDVCAVILAFGFEEMRFDNGIRTGIEFFYEAMKAAVVDAGQWEWFREAHTSKQSEEKA